MVFFVLVVVVVIAREPILSALRKYLSYLLIELKSGVEDEPLDGQEDIVEPEEDICMS
jgi:hypothetical protein